MLQKIGGFGRKLGERGWTNSTCLIYLWYIVSRSVVWRLECTVFAGMSVWVLIAVVSIIPNSPTDAQNITNVIGWQCMTNLTVTNAHVCCPVFMTYCTSASKMLFSWFTISCNQTHGCTKFVFHRGSAPDPVRAAHDAPQTFLLAGEKDIPFYSPPLLRRLRRLVLSACGASTWVVVGVGKQPTVLFGWCCGWCAGFKRRRGNFLPVWSVRGAGAVFRHTPARNRWWHRQ